MFRTLAGAFAVSSIVACGDPPSGPAQRRAYVARQSRTQVAPDSACFGLIVRPGEPLPPFETWPDLNDPHIQQCS